MHEPCRARSNVFHNPEGSSWGAPGTAEQNIALQKAVMNKIAENGGKVPDNLRH